MAMGKRFDPALLVRLRDLEVIDVMKRLAAVGAVSWRVDRDFVAERDVRTRRLFVSVPSGMSWELVVTGARWYDTRAKLGGGGAVDLWMHLSGKAFAAAVNELVVWRVDRSPGSATGSDPC